ncbi:MAG: hypothetical protein RDU24_10215 [Humidesulfovibrio sp.]|uniref:nucleoside recognition domain-containing protein n=1 Tax=Humidesulfovibrio sp. TaxID=2910988 RepID=UPI0027EEC6F0|nr:nucleoside recognition domain-containing protein [Humidesulfovibrio sp.]MDQ7835745.1 hypothetical protein [Humidesulfovibrio sp.]
MPDRTTLATAPNQTASSLAAALRRAVWEVLAQSLRVCRELFVVMVPVVIGVKVLQELGAVPWLAWPLTPLMTLVGLPPEMGLVWATALLNNIYSAIIVFLTLNTTLTQAQMTVLATLILVAHNMPVELGIARKSGARLRFQILSRFFGALILGMILNAAYHASGTLQDPAVVLFAHPQADPAPSLWLWAVGEASKLVSIALIITALMAVMRLLTEVGAIGLLNRLLRPVLAFIGIGQAASGITVAGLTLGVTYGGGLIINEAQSGRVDKRDVFFSLTLMGLCHSLIEDTLLMAMLGAHLSGILWARLLFALGATALLVKCSARLAPGLADRLLWSDLARTPAP